MRFGLSFKVLLRTPGKTIITVILLAAVSLALFTRVGEYAATSREIRRISRDFIGVGYVQREPPSHNSFFADEALFGNAYFTSLTTEDIEALISLPYISRGSTRYMTAGISADGFLRAAPHSDYYDFTARFIIEGTFRRSWQGRNEHRSRDMQTHVLNFTDLEVLAGFPRIKADVEHYFPFTMFLLTFPPDALRNPEDHILRYETPGFTHSVIKPEFGFGFEDTLRRSHRYIITATFNHDRWLHTPVYSGDRAMQMQIPSIIAADDKDNYPQLNELIRLIEDDRHTFDMVYTDDMRAIMRFHEDRMRLVSGRLLTPADTRNNAQVCVVSRHFMNVNNLELGDIITFRLGDYLHSQNAALGAVAVIPERRHSSEVIVELEIVGVYHDVDSLRSQAEAPYRNYSNNTIFLPLSLLPDTVNTANHEVLPSEFSLVIDNPRNISAFLEKTAHMIEDMGFTLEFSDGGWLGLELSFNTTGRLSIVAIIGFSLAVAVTLGLITYLYIGRKVRDYAVMRALGVTKRKAGTVLFTPLILIASFAIIGGSTAGFIYTERNINSELSVPLSSLFICIIAQITMLTAFALFGLRRLSLKPPLALLQSGNYIKRKDKPIPESASAALGILPKLGDVNRKFGAMRFTLRYVLLRSRRAPLKSLLIILLITAFFGAIGQFAAMRYTYYELYENIEVRGKFLSGMPLLRAQDFAEKDFVRDPYFEIALEDVELNNTPVQIHAVSDIERFIGGTQLTSITYDVHHDPEREDYIILGSELMDILGLHFGDEVQICFSEFRQRIKTQNPSAGDERFGILLRRQSAFYTVGGRLESSNTEHNNTAFIPVNDVIYPLFNNPDHGYTIPLTYAEFTLADNLQAEEFRAYGIRRSGDRGRSFVFDTSELESITASKALWSALFPIVSIALVVMGGLLSALLILQSSREAAIFRVLSASKKRIRAILIINQTAYCLIGIMLGIAAVQLINNNVIFREIIPVIGLYAVMFFALNFITAIVCSIIVTKHNILELLQTKE